MIIKLNNIIANYQLYKIRKIHKINKFFLNNIKKHINGDNFYL
jgi:hypothetical protein